MANEEEKVVAKGPAPVASENAEKRPEERSDRRPGDRRGGRRFNGPRKPIVKEYEERVVRISKVTKVVKGGKRMKFSALVVVGNGKGKYGYGLAKSGEVPEAIKKAIASAERDIHVLPIAKNDSIRHEVEGEYGATKVFLKPAPAGTGIVAGGPVRAILELAGIKNVYSKVYGSRFSLNIIKATVLGLSQLKSETPKQELEAEQKAAAPKEEKAD